MTTPRRSTWIWLSAVAASLAAGGCGLSDSKIFRSHTAPDRKAEARRHWDDLRGNARLQLAQRHLDAGRISDAEKELDAAMVASPEGMTPYLLATRIRLEKGELAEAREALAAARRRGDDPELDYLDGIIHQRYGEIEAALASYARAAEKNPLVPEYTLARAEMLVTLDRQAEALELVTARLRDFDRNAPLRFLAARIARNLDQKEAAVEHAQEAARLSENDPTAAAYLGDTLLWAGQSDAALDVLRPLVTKWLNTKPDADAELDLDDEGRAARDAFARTASARTSQDADAARQEFALGVMHNIAQACLATNRHRDARELLAPWVKRNPDDALSATHLARALLSLDDAPAAADVLNRAHHAATPTPESLLLLAYAELKRDRPAEAARAARAAITLDERLTPALCLLGRAEAAQGRVNQARAAYRRALAIDPDSPVAKALLQRLPLGGRREKNTPVDEPAQAAANRPVSMNLSNEDSEDRSCR